MIPPEGWDKPSFDPQMSAEAAAMVVLDKLDLKISPLKQCPNGTRGTYQLALVSSM